MTDSLCAFLLTAVVLLPTAVGAPPRANEAAPDFALKSLEGGNLRLSEYRGEVVVLNFWSTRCGRCRDQLGELDALYTNHRNQGLRLLSVNIDKDEETVREAVADLGLRFPVLLDDTSRVSKLYDLRKIPFTVIIDPTGTVRYVHAGYRRGDEQHYDNETGILISE